VRKPLKLSKHLIFVRSPGWDRVETLQALCHIVFQAVFDLVMSFECHGSLAFLILSVYFCQSI